MMRQGPIPLFAHGLVEYAAGVFLVASPFLFSFDSGAAVAVAIAAGVVIIAVAASTDGPTSLIDQVPLSAHVALDYVVVPLFIAMPFLAGFSDETAPTVVFVALGVAHLLLTIGTRFRPPAEDEGRRRRPRQGA